MSITQIRWFFFLHDCLVQTPGDLSELKSTFYSRPLVQDYNNVDADLICFSVI